MEDKRKVFCIGLGKTGTTTFKHCSRILRLRHKTGPIVLGLAGLSLGHTAKRQAEERLIGVAQHYDAFGDYPWPYLYETLSAAFPNALFVMTRRSSVEKWYISLCRHYDRTGPTEAKRLAYGYYSPYDNPHAHKQLYEEHLASARDYFCGSNHYKEFCWENGDGWPELCNFLEMPQPELPFPHANANAGRRDSESLTWLLRHHKYAHAVSFVEQAGSDPDQCKQILEKHICAEIDALVPSSGNTESIFRRLMHRVRRAEDAGDV